MKGKSIAILETDPLYQGVLEKIFRDLGYSVKLLTNPKTGLSEKLLAIGVRRLDDEFVKTLEAVSQANHADLTTILFYEEVGSLKSDALSRFGKLNFFTRFSTKEEILFFVEKTFHPERAFGLANYLKADCEQISFSLTSSREVSALIERILKRAAEWGFVFDYECKIDIIIHELIQNALYHAHDFERDKELGNSVTLAQESAITIDIGHDENRFGVAVTDRSGSLEREDIFESIGRIKRRGDVRQILDEGLRIEEVITNSGRGLEIVCRHSGECHFVIEREKRTQTIVIFDKFYCRDDQSIAFKVIEV